VGAFGTFLARPNGLFKFRFSPESLTHRTHLAKDRELVLPPMLDHPGLSVTESLTGHHRRQFYELHRSLGLLMVLILFLAPFAGLHVTGLLGSVVGVVLSVVVYYLMPPLWRMFGC
jgi:hypothetical protein